MKNAHEIHGKMAAGAAMALALGMAASAQMTGRPARPGIALPKASLEGDIREGRGPRQAPKPTWGGEIVVPEQSLRLGVRFVLGEVDDPTAIFPMAGDLDLELVVEGGTSGGMAMIQLGLVTPSLDPLGAELAGGHVILGSFDEAGEIVVFLPKELDVRGLGARAAQIEGRFVSKVINVEEAVNDAFATFDPLASLADPSAVGGSGSKHELHRPARGAGHAAAGQITGPMATRLVDLSGDVVETPFATFDKLGEIAKPQATGAGGSKHELRRPSRGAGQASRAQVGDRTATRSVDLSNDAAADDNTSFEKVGDIANPAQVGGSGSMTKLHKLSRGGHGRPL